VIPLILQRHLAVRDELTPHPAATDTPANPAASSGE
jgi:hypothetical protein